MKGCLMLWRCLMLWKKIIKILLGLIFKKDKKNITQKFQTEHFEDAI